MGICGGLFANVEVCMLKGILAALAGGAVGAAVWAAIAYYTNYEVGLVAWGIGALVGFAMSLGARDVQSSLCGVIAAVIALASIAGGKYAVVQVFVNQDAEKFQKSFEITEEHTKMYVAYRLIEEYEKDGKTLTWPEGYNEENAEKPEHFPKDLWKDTQARWDALSDDQKAVYEKATRESFQKFVSEKSLEATNAGFLASYSFWDALWAFLALGSAYKLGSGQGGED
jgi:hypothetical protein